MQKGRWTNSAFNSTKLNEHIIPMKKITALLLLMLLMLFMQQNVDAQRMINLSTGATMAVYTPSSSIAKGKAIII